MLRPGDFATYADWSAHWASLTEAEKHAHMGSLTMAELMDDTAAMARFPDVHTISYRDELKGISR